MSEADAKAQGLLTIIGKEIDDAYMVELKKQIVHPEIIKEVADEIKIVYTPLHGTGLVPVKRVLAELGFKMYMLYRSRSFLILNLQHWLIRTRKILRPLNFAIKLAKEVGADIILATDPDADRLGVYALDTKSGEYVSFTGNMSGMLIAEYLLREKDKDRYHA